MIFKFLALLALVVLTFSAGSSFARSEIVMRLAQLRVLELVRAMGFSQDPPFYVINEAIFVSHHSEIRGGAEDFRTYWGRVAADTAQVIKIFQDGDYVFAQSRYELNGLKAGFDVFRYENGEIVEHWGGAVAFADDLVGGPGSVIAAGKCGTMREPVTPAPFLFASSTGTLQCPLTLRSKTTSTVPSCSTEPL